MEPQSGNSTGFSPPKSEEPVILSCKLNSLGNSVLAITKTGFRIYVVDANNKVTLQHEHDINGEINIVERLCSTNLIAYTTKAAPDVFVVYHCKRKRIVCDFRYPGEIQTIRFNRQRVIISLKDMVYIHNVRNMQIVQLLKELPETKRPVIDLANSETNSYLAVPWKAEAGSVRVYDVQALQDVACIQAHEHELAMVRFDQTATKLATSSIKGTCIRIFDSVNGRKLYEFRRGFKDVAIQSLSFSSDNTFLSVTSDSDTIHVFKMDESNKLEDPASNASERSVASFQNPTEEKNIVGGFVKLNAAADNLLICSPNGHLFIYELKNEEGAYDLVPLGDHKLTAISERTPDAVNENEKRPATPELRKDESVDERMASLLINAPVVPIDSKIEKRNRSKSPKPSPRASPVRQANASPSPSRAQTAENGRENEANTNSRPGTPVVRRENDGSDRPRSVSPRATATHADGAQVGRKASSRSPSVDRREGSASPRPRSRPPRSESANRSGSESRPGSRNPSPARQ